MTAIVLVHGAWGGSWGFHKLRPLLAAAGHQVFTPSLTGIGEREHLSRPDIGLGTHVTDVCSAVHYEDLDGIVLLGFSYGGMVVTGALDRIGHRVRHLVYLDAFVPDDGQSVQDLAGFDVPAPASDAATGDISSWTIAPVPRDLGNPAQTAWVNERRSPQPIATFTEPVRLSRPLESWDFSRTYVKATADPDEADDSAFNRAAAKARTSQRWRYHEVACNHMVAIMKPDELASILLSLASEGN